MALLIMDEKGHLCYSQKLFLSVPIATGYYQEPVTSPSDDGTPTKMPNMDSIISLFS